MFIWSATRQVKETDLVNDLYSIFYKGRAGRGKIMFKTQILVEQTVFEMSSFFLVSINF